MKAPKKRNKTYKPRHVSPVGGLFAFGKQYAAAEDRAPMTDDQVSDIVLSYRIAFEAMLTGGASEEHWSSCACSLNIAIVLAERGLGEEHIPAFNDALEGAFRARIRAGRTGAWGFDGDAIQAIKTAFLIHDEQLQLATKQEIREALREVHRRVDAGNVYREAA